MNNSKLISKEVNGLETVYTLVPGTKLSEVMDELPHGIINKNYTGIGGTTLELDCNRNSIVVEPLKETAWTKAQKPSLHNKYKIFYFGSKSYLCPFPFITLKNLESKRRLTSIYFYWESYLDFIPFICSSPITCSL